MNESTLIFLRGIKLYYTITQMSEYGFDGASDVASAGSDHTGGSDHIETTHVISLHLVDADLVRASTVSRDLLNYHPNDVRNVMMDMVTSWLPRGVPYSEYRLSMGVDAIAVSLEDATAWLAQYFMVRMADAVASHTDASPTSEVTVFVSRHLDHERILITLEDVRHPVRGFPPRAIKVWIGPSTTLDNVMDQQQKEWGVAPRIPMLRVGVDTIRIRDTPLCRAFRFGDIVQLDEVQEDETEHTFPVFVKMISGSTTRAIDVRPSMCVAHLLQIIHETDGSPPVGARLLYERRLLHLYQTMGDAGVERDATMHVLYSLRGD